NSPPYSNNLTAFMRVLLAHLVARGGVPSRGVWWGRGRTRLPGQRCRRCSRRARTIPASTPYPCCTAGLVRLASARTQSAGPAPPSGPPPPPASFVRRRRDRSRGGSRPRRRGTRARRSSPCPAPQSSAASCPARAPRRVALETVGLQEVLHEEHRTQNHMRGEAEAAHG